MPDVSSPLLVGDRLLCAKDGGIVSAFDGATGALGAVRRLDVRGEVFASPVEGGGKVYVAWFDGVVAVLDEGTLETLSSVHLGGEIAATPALAGDTVLVRTATELLAFREGADAPRRPPRGSR